MKEMEERKESWRIAASPSGNGRLEELLFNCFPFHREREKRARKKETRTCKDGMPRHSLMTSFIGCAWLFVVAARILDMGLTEDRMVCLGLGEVAWLEVYQGNEEVD